MPVPRGEVYISLKTEDDESLSSFLLSELSRKDPFRVAVEDMIMKIVTNAEH